MPGIQRIGNVFYRVRDSDMDSAPHQAEVAVAQQ
jgi:hypothetical protein